MGAPAKSGRIAYGALLIRERLGLADEETAEQVQENPYLQYFLGLEEFRDGPLFDPSMMAHFRSRFTGERHRRINERILREATVAKDDDEKFGNAKRKGTLDRIMAKLAHTSEIAGVSLARPGRSLAAHAGSGYSNGPPKLARL